MKDELITKSPSSTFYLVAFDDNAPQGAREEIVKVIAKLNGDSTEHPDISPYRIQRSLYYIRSNQENIEKHFQSIDLGNDDLLIVPVSPLNFSPRITWSNHSDAVMSKLI